MMGPPDGDPAVRSWLLLQGADCERDELLPATELSNKAILCHLCRLPPAHQRGIGGALGMGSRTCDLRLRRLPCSIP